MGSRALPIPILCDRYDQTCSFFKASQSSVKANALSVDIRALRESIEAQVKTKLSEIRGEPVSLPSLAQVTYFEAWLRLRGGWL